MEFKLQLDLSTNEGKSKLAKEICALCNYGGGWIVLGREDNGNYPEALPPELSGVTGDTINQIASAYLTPAPHCTLRWLQPENVTFDVPIISVPSLDAIPICGKKNGPTDAQGRFVGVRKGVHYTRSAGPVSAEIDSPEKWQSVVRKCVLNNKKSLLAGLSVMISQPEHQTVAEPNRLDVDFVFMVDRWVGQTKGVEYGAELSGNFIAFSFELIGSAEQPTVTTDDIRAALAAIPSRHYGPHKFFEDGMHDAYAPYVFENAGVAGVQVDCVEADGGAAVMLPSIWRINEACCGVEVVALWEDTYHLKSSIEGRSTRKWVSGENFWLGVQISYLETFLSNLSKIAQKLGIFEKVRIKLLYCGLAGRRLNSPHIFGGFIPNHRARQDKKEVDLTFELAALEDDVRSATIAKIFSRLINSSRARKSMPTW